MWPSQSVSQTHNPSQSFALVAKLIAALPHAAQRKESTAVRVNRKSNSSAKRFMLETTSILNSEAFFPDDLTLRSQTTF